MNRSRCDEMKEFLVELLYDEIPPEHWTPLEAHLEDCEHCRQDLAELRQVRAGLAEAAQEEPRADAPRVLVLPLRRRRSPLRFAKLAAAAAVILVASLGILNARIGWSEAGPLISFGLTAPAAALTDEERLLVDQASRVVHQVEAQSMQQREALLAAFRDELNRKQRKDAEELESMMATLLDDLDRRRNQDMRYVLTELGSLEVRTGREMARTNQLLEIAVQASTAEIGLER
jgi:uncharacterized protein YhaN